MTWINTTDYTEVELILCGVGCFFWLIAYAAVLLGIRRHGFVEVPVAGVAANISWEFVWGFVYTPDLGMLFAWMYRAAFLMDIFITWMIFREGHKQIQTPVISRFLGPAMVFGIAAWTAGLIGFVEGGFDNSYGAYSGYILNVQLSALYVFLILSLGSSQGFSEVVAWTKMIGTALLSIFGVLVLGNDLFFISMAVVTFALDILYIYVLRRSPT